MCIFTNFFFFFLWKYYFYLNILNLYISYIFLHFGDWLQYTKTLTSPTTIIKRIKYWKIYIYIYYQHTQGDHPLKEQLHKIWHFDELFFKFLWEWQVLYDTVSLTYSIHHHCFPSLMYLSLCISIHWFGIFIGNWIFFLNILM